MTSIISEETKARDAIVEVGRSLFDRKFTHGSTGNISLRLSDGTFLMTPTNACLGSLRGDDLTRMAANGGHLSGKPATKEAFLHRCMYCSRTDAGAVIHLHSTYSVAVSILADVNPDDVIPPLTAYYVMRVGRLPLIPFFPPGDEELARAVGAMARSSRAVLLANHGPVVSGKTLEAAQYACEELEETAKLFIMMRNQDVRALSPGQAEAVQSVS